MKQTLSRLTALILILSLALTPAALASIALGTELHMAQRVLGKNTTVTTQSLWSDTYSDLRTERYLTYTPNPAVRPVVAYGETVLSRRTLTQMAKGLESYGNRVLGGANGDYFVLATGAPLGMVVTDGILRSSSAYHYAVGFLPDGTAFVGQPYLTITASFRGYDLTVNGGYNKVREAVNGYSLYNRDFGANTQNSDPGYDVVLRPVANAETGEVPPARLVIGGGAVPCVVEAVVAATKATDIPEGCFILSVNAMSTEFLVTELSALQVGDTVTLGASTDDPRWGQAQQAMGAYAQIIVDGKVTDNLEANQNPRTALGVKPDGSTVLYTIDGRQAGYSVGASVKQVAQRLVELGCTQGVLFDGGGSTTFGTTAPTDASFAVTNSPSDGAQRSVTNALFFVASSTPTGELGSLAVQPGDGILLAGATLGLSAHAIDTNFIPMYAVDSGVAYTAQGEGTIADTTLTAGTTAGSVIVTAQSGEAMGEGQFTVITSPTKIALSDEATGQTVTSFNLQPGETRDLKATATWRNLKVTSQDVCYTWSVDEALGAIDENGLFTASAGGGSGSITVTAGSTVVTIPVSVAGHVYTLENFEGGLAHFAQSDTVTLTQTTQQDKVKYGKKSLVVTYQTAEGSAFFPADLPLATGERYLGLWVYGDGLGTTLTANVALADGNVADMAVITTDFVGWKQVLAPLPQGATALKGMVITPPADTTQGVLYLDHFITANDPIYDVQPPVVKTTLKGGTLTATVLDNTDRTFSTSRITVSCDGQTIPYTLSDGTITAPYTITDGALHRFTVTVTDASGNIGRGSATLEATNPLDPFLDTAGHWSAPFATYLYTQGISQGIAADGGFCYAPGKNITRGDFALMLARWLRLDLQTDGAQLPFADANEIPAWSAPAIGVLYRLGVFGGSSQEGALYANANASITRAEAMTMLGRVQPRGYGRVAERFQDDGLIPAWASDHVYSLAAQGVIAGYQGMVRPGDPVTRGEMAKMLCTMQ